VAEKRTETGLDFKKKGTLRRGRENHLTGSGKESKLGKQSPFRTQVQGKKRKGDLDGKKQGNG